MCLYRFRILGLRFDQKRQPQHDKALRGIQPVDDPTVEPKTKGNVSAIK